MRDGVWLITYADRVGGTLRGLSDLLRSDLADLFVGVHVLPFFIPIDGVDTGFDPTDHTQVDPRLGRWSDLEALAQHTDVMADAIVNHVSRDSPQFRDVLAHGDDSRYASLFLTFDRVFPDGATEDDLLRLYRPRPGLPLSDVRRADGTRRIMWTTFASAQLDIDVEHSAGEAYLREVLSALANHGTSVVRLDAVGYAVKRAGTSSFMLPETFAFIERLAQWSRELGMETLVEIHSHYLQQIAIAERVDWVYDFALPPLVLHALFTGRAAELRGWLVDRPRNAVTVLDTHDGIGVLDVGADVTDRTRAGLLSNDDISHLVDRIHANSGGASRLATGTAAVNLDLYQVNSTFFDAMGRDEQAYLLARLIQFLIPGIPQVYYVGLLAGANDLELLQRTGVGRDVNRHRYLPDELTAALEQRVVQHLMALIRLRNTHPAFAGSWSLGEEGGDSLAMRWDNGDAAIECHIDLRGHTFRLTLVDQGRKRVVTDFADL